MHPNGQSSTIYNSQDRVVTHVSIDRGMYKQLVYINIYTGILLSINKIMPFVATCIDLEIIILSDVKSERKGKYHMTSLTCEIWNMVQMKSEVKVAQSCLTLCDPMDYIIHGILQARILEWVAFPFSRGSSQPRDRTQVFHIAGGFFTSWATREAQEYWNV